MIEIESLSFTYPDTDMPVLRDISLCIAPGEVILICGASGSGKSTLLYCLNGLIPSVFPGVLTGTIRVNGFSPRERSIREISQTIGTVFQNPESQIFMLRVEDDVAFGCENLLLPREEIIRRRDNALEAMGLWDMRSRETSTLSGGQKQRLAISSVYAMEPGVFLFDEPTTDLDQEGRREFFHILEGLKKEKKTVIMVEHQFDEYQSLIDRVITLDEGRIVENEAFPFSPATAREKVPATARDVVVLEGIGFDYERGKTVLECVDMRIRAGEVVALQGANGSGKTTLLKILAGLLMPGRGRVIILGLQKPGLESLVGRVGFLFQNPDEQLFTGSVEEEIAFGAVRLGRKASVDAYLEISGLETVRKRHPQTISRGQRQILALISVMAMEPEILVLDEPTTGLDSKSWRELMSLLYAFADRGGAVIFSTHNSKAAEAASRRVIVESGRVVGDEVSI